MVDALLMRDTVEVASQNSVNSAGFVTRVVFRAFGLARCWPRRRLTPRAQEQHPGTRRRPVDRVFAEVGASFPDMTTDGRRKGPYPQTDQGGRFANPVPVITIALAIALLREIPSTEQIVGGLVVLTGVDVANLAKPPAAADGARSATDSAPKPGVV